MHAHTHLCVIIKKYDFSGEEGANLIFCRPWLWHDSRLIAVHSAGTCTENRFMKCCCRAVLVILLALEAEWMAWGCSADPVGGIGPRARSSMGSEHRVSPQASCLEELPEPQQIMLSLPLLICHRISVPMGSPLCWIKWPCAMDSAPVLKVEHHCFTTIGQNLQYTEMFLLPGPCIKGMFS